LEVAKKLQRDSVIIEEDYRSEEVIMINMDVYNLFIAANITKNVTPVALNFTMQKVLLVYVIQILISGGFVYDYLTFDRFQPFFTMQTSLRLIASLLFH
jgi:hypothetical protein